MIDPRNVRVYLCARACVPLFEASTNQCQLGFNVLRQQYFHYDVTRITECHFYTSFFYFRCTLHISPFNNALLYQTPNTKRKLAGGGEGEAFKAIKQQTFSARTMYTLFKKSGHQTSDTPHLKFQKVKWFK